MPLYCLSVFLLSCMGLRLSFGEFVYLGWSFFLGLSFFEVRGDEQWRE